MDLQAEVQICSFAVLKKWKGLNWMDEWNKIAMQMLWTKLLIYFSDYLSLYMYIGEGTIWHDIVTIRLLICFFVERLHARNKMFAIPVLHLYLRWPISDAGLLYIFPQFLQPKLSSAGSVEKKKRHFYGSHWFKSWYWSLLINSWDT